MRFDIVTIFPAMIRQALAAGTIGRAIEHGRLSVAVHDLRDFTDDRHRMVDDVPYGGGPGMVLKPGPLFRALDSIAADGRKEGTAPFVILTSPQGTRLTQRVAHGLCQRPQIAVLCGRYEGVDERVRSRVDTEISIGDYVLSGGELPALVIVDTVARLVPGVVGDERSVVEDSFSRGLLDYPQYTRPADLQEAGVCVPPGVTGRVPDVLLSGNHAAIRRWRKREALQRTLARRPDLLAGASLDEEERELLHELRADGASS
jgi:tRNA (guanine37-N1)-methyltransferase